MIEWGNGITFYVPPLGEVQNFLTDYFLLKIKFLAKYKGLFTIKTGILLNACCVQDLILVKWFKIFFKSIFFKITYIFKFWVISITQN